MSDQESGRPPGNPGSPGTGRAAEHLWGFLRALRQAGLTPAPPRQADFFQAVAESAPRDITALYWYARLTLLSGAEEIGVFDDVFDAWFRHGRTAAAVPPASQEDSGTRSPQERGDGALPPQEGTRGDGVEAAADVTGGGRTFGPSDERQRELMRALRSAWPVCLPAVRSRRLRPSRTGRRLDLREVWRQARRTGGEIVRLPRSARPRRPRRVLLLVDVSGSLKQHSPDLLRAAHTAVHAAGSRAEVFTFATRLTRVTTALSHPDPDRALRSLSRTVLDTDGGTAIGPALEEFLANTRFLAAARGAFVIVVSDGLERGDPGAMIGSAGRLSRLGHRLVWWSPLACSPAYRPLTRGMAGQLHHLDHLGGVRDLESALAEVRRIPAIAAGLRRAARNRWTRPAGKQSPHRTPGPAGPSQNPPGAPNPPGIPA